jgi:hypothetical protein
MECWIGYWIYWPLTHTLLETTRNYSAISNLHNSQIITAHARSYPACCVFNSRSLATASKSGDPLTSRVQILSEWRLPYNCLFSSQNPMHNWLGCRVESYVTTDGQSASLSWCQAFIWGPRPDFYYCQTVAGLLMWGAVSDERTGLSFTIAAGPRQRSHSRVRGLWD